MKKPIKKKDGATATRSPAHEALTSIPIRTLAARFRLAAVEDFPTKSRNIEPRFERLLRAHYEKGTPPLFSGAPKLKVEYPPSGAIDKAIEFDLINEVGIELRVLNGTVLAVTNSVAKWPQLAIACDHLLHAYRETLERPSPHDFMIDLQTVVRLTQTTNYKVLSPIINVADSTASCFQPVFRLADAHSVSVQPERVDSLVTLNVGKVEFVYNIEGPANEKHSLLWLGFQCRTPQEEYATEDTFSLATIEPYLRGGLSVIEMLLAEQQVELVRNAND